MLDECHPVRAAKCRSSVTAGSRRQQTATVPATLSVPAVVVAATPRILRHYAYVRVFYQTLDHQYPIIGHHRDHLNHGQQQQQNQQKQQQNQQQQQQQGQPQPQPQHSRPVVLVVGCRTCCTRHRYLGPSSTSSRSSCDHQRHLDDLPVPSGGRRRGQGAWTSQLGLARMELGHPHYQLILDSSSSCYQLSRKLGQGQLELVQQPLRCQPVQLCPDHRPCWLGRGAVGQVRRQIVRLAYQPQWWYVVLPATLPRLEWYYQEHQSLRPSIQHGPIQQCIGFVPPPVAAHILGLLPRRVPICPRRQTSRVVLVRWCTIPIDGCDRCGYFRL